MCYLPVFEGFVTFRLCSMSFPSGRAPFPEAASWEGRPEASAD